MYFPNKIKLTLALFASLSHVISREIASSV